MPSSAGKKKRGNRAIGPRLKMSENCSRLDDSTAGCNTLVEVSSVSLKVSKDVRVHFFFNDTATTEIYTLSLHEALPIFTWLSGPGYSLTKILLASGMDSAGKARF